MRHNELLDTLQNLIQIKPKQRELAEILNLRVGVIGQRASRNSCYSLEELSKIEQHYGIEFLTNYVVHKAVSATYNRPDYYNIPYWENLPNDLKLPSLTTKWEDIETIVNLWGRKPENLRVVAMYGNAMAGYWYPLNNRDLLYIDTSSTDITKSGVFFFTTNGNKNMFIRELSLDLAGNVKFKRYEPNSQVFEKVYTQEQLNELDFKVIGRVIKNINFNL